MNYSKKKIFYLPAGFTELFWKEHPIQPVSYCHVTPE